MSKFVKISQLDPESKKELKKYWTPLYGSEFADAMVKDYDTDKSETKPAEQK